MTGTTQQPDVQISFTGDVGKVVIGGSRFEVTPDGRVTAYTDQKVFPQPLAKAIDEKNTASIGKDFSVAVYGAKIMKAEAGFTIQAASIAQRPPAIGLAQRALEVGQRLSDGTVVLSVDLNKNEVLFVPAKIFGGEARFDRQDNVVESANKDSLHGHKDWRRITDAEGVTLSEAWDKVAPAELQGRAAPWFWLDATEYDINGRVRQGGEPDWDRVFRFFSLPVPLVRSGPAIV
ncbi:MAG: hypothetical protein HYS17_06030 [Micavibrio aeruginosavorus]|uniref:Uncharacterized protein n=1 Tax=Micavibrio aeruginosavorus TaxID=349221 RepID=A0A7T5R4E7_9BACT|nr:MAG: hypothetical protein HYS17_06030 [Micavibrio aeruginosavorus]